MCIAGIGAESSQDPDSKVSKRFRVFLFTFAKSFMHELAHIFVTSLGPTGKTRTPPHIRGSEEGDDPTGEAGRYIENLIFGGRVIIIRNNAEGEGQVCSYSPTLMGGLAYELTHSLGRHMFPC